MKFALVDGKRSEAQPKISAVCPACNNPMVAKCGEKVIWHWAHRGTRTCEPWWENETEWHRRWKDQFPIDWQEVICFAEDGEKHIADVRTDHGWVIEFQHSYIPPEERRCRDAFYKKLVWVIDATRRKTDGEQFRKALEASAPIGPFIRRIHLDKCRLLKEWSGSPGSIFFDFGYGPTLWWLFARHSHEPAYVAPFSRSEFLATLRGKGSEGASNFDEATTAIGEIVTQCNAHFRSQALMRTPLHSAGFPQAFVRGRARRRL